MFRLITVFALVSCAFAGTLPNDSGGRIVNGNDTTIEAHPYQVSLQSTSGKHFCGGSLINKDTVVTAAHCLERTKASKIQIRLGSTQYNKGGELVSVKSFKKHEGYNTRTVVNDVAVIKLDTPVRESSSIRFIRLAEKAPKTGTPAVVTGWGTTCFLECKTLPTTLQMVKVDIVEEKDCASDNYNYGSKVMPTMICAYALNKDACQMDSGGPLVAEDRLVGIVSWGNGCAREGYPGVYADVASLHKWIKEVAESL